MAIANHAHMDGQRDSRTFSRVLTTVAAVATASCLLQAQARDPAPIEFAGAKTSQSYQQVASAPSSSARLGKTSKRVEYRYPDQPDMVFGAQGPRVIQGDVPPMAFSSSTSAISVKSAMKVSHTKNERPRPSNAATTGYAKQKVGAPYQIAGKWYVPAEEPNYNEVGIGSWYGPNFHGKPTATGEVFDQHAMTAAHTTLPIPSLARVTNLENGQSIVVRINDRGPFVDDRIIDLSRKAATSIGYINSGTAKVRVEYLGPAPKEHNVVPVQYAQQNAVQPSSRPLTPVRQTTPAPTQAGSSDGYKLQLGSFSELKNAHVLRQKMQVHGPVEVKEAFVSGRELFRVYLGPWTTKSEAMEHRQRLKSAGVDSFVVSP